MTHHAPPSTSLPGFDPGRQVAQLREALTLVAEIAGRDVSSRDAALNEAARLSAAYEAAPPIVQRRFDALAAETAAWAASGVEALLAARAERPAKAAASRLADELERGLAGLGALVDL